MFIAPTGEAQRGSVSGRLWRWKHSCGGEGIGVPNRIMQKSPAYCDHCRPEHLRGRPPKSVTSQPGYKPKTKSQCWALRRGEKNIHTCGCTKKQPCARASRLFALGMWAYLRHHLEFTYRPEGTAVSAEYTNPFLSDENGL